MSIIQKKIVIVGDAAVGKTCILIVRDQGQIPWYIPNPTVFDEYETEVDVNGQQITLSISDVSGYFEPDSMRKLAYPNTDAILMCYSLASTSSLYNIMDGWQPEVRKFCPNVPIVLVGTKLDLKDDPDGDTIDGQYTNELVLRVKNKIQPYAHIECSAITKQGIDDVFIVAAMAALQSNHANKAAAIGKCCIVS